MQFLTIREFSKAPKQALLRLAEDGKAVLTNNGKPAAILLNVDAENFEQVFAFVQQVEKKSGKALSDERIIYPSADLKKRKKAFDLLMSFPKKKLPADFDYKKELLDARDEKYGSVD